MRADGSWQVEWFFHFAADSWTTADRRADDVSIDGVACVRVVPVITAADINNRSLKIIND